MEHGGYFNEGFSMQTGTGGSATATTRFLETRMRAKGIKAAWALGGQTGGMVDLHNKGLIGTLLDTQSFDSVAAELAAHLAEPCRDLDPGLRQPNRQGLLRSTASTWSSCRPWRSTSISTSMC